MIKSCRELHRIFLPDLCRNCHFRLFSILSTNCPAPASQFQAMQPNSRLDTRTPQKFHNLSKSKRHSWLLNWRMYFFSRSEHSLALAVSFRYSLKPRRKSRLLLPLGDTRAPRSPRYSVRCLRPKFPSRTPTSRLAHTCRHRYLRLQVTTINPTARPKHTILSFINATQQTSTTCSD